MPSWTKRHTPDDATATRTKTVEAFYTGAVLDAPASYLTRHAQGESAEAYAERCAIADYTGHYGFAVDSLAGRLLAEDARTRRDYVEVDPDTKRPSRAGGLGSPDDPGAIMERLWYDADGKGTPYPVVFGALAPKLVAHGRWGLLAAGTTLDARGDVAADAHVRPVSPADVVAVARGRRGRLSQVLLAEPAPAPDTLDADAPPTAARGGYLWLRLDGWDRLDADGDPTGERGAYAYYANALRREGDRVLPFRLVEVGLRADLGYRMAQKARALFNFESGLDFLLWIANFPRMRFETQAHFDATRPLLAAGFNAVIGPNTDYITPPTDAAEMSLRVLEAKVAAFYRTFFRSYEDAAREKTATEINQDARSGEGAYLNFLAAALDEAENFALSIWEQTYFPNRPDTWGQARVERPRDFKPVNADEITEGLLARYLDRKVPIGEAATAALVEKALTADGVPFDHDAVLAAVKEAAGDPGALADRATRTADALARRRAERDAARAGGDGADVPLGTP